MFRTRFNPLITRCKNHPKHKQSPGVCSVCLFEKLSRLPATSTSDLTSDRAYNNNNSSNSSSFSSLSSSDISTGDSSSPMSPSTVARLYGRSGYSRSAYLRHAVSDVSTTAKPMMGVMNVKLDQGKRKLQEIHDDDVVVVMEKSRSRSTAGVIMKKGRFSWSKLSVGSSCCREVHTTTSLISDKFKRPVLSNRNR